MRKEIGIVVIGRNEGERLKRCLKSVLGQVEMTVYVDSGSSDGSVEFAESKGVAVVRLDMSAPFSAARARNAGFEYLMSISPSLAYIHFIDGDCELHFEWLGHACKFLYENPRCAIVAGILKEKNPENTVYNLLCDIEWNVPAGKVRSCGGIITVRTSAFIEIHGFNPTVVAGEEPDLCYRLIKKGWEIYRITYFMALHDADMKKFSQWWRRTVRSGHAYAQGCNLHGWDLQGYGVKESGKIWFWALLFPMSVMLSSVAVNPSFLLFYTAYLFQFVKIAVNAKKRLGNAKHAVIYSFFIVVAKWPQLLGQLTFINRQLKKERISFS